MLRVLDLFSGIGGFSLGLERTGGFRTVAFCEIDPFCRRVLAKHWPEVPCYDDVRTLTAERLAADGISVDIICGGFPCQDISAAGKRVGIDGERSGLWSEYARIIGELRPLYVIVENVSALLHRGMDTVLGDLAALGFDAEWHCIPASAIGAPHRRDRVWIVGHSAGCDVAYADGRRQPIKRQSEHAIEQGAPRHKSYGRGETRRWQGADVSDSDVEGRAQSLRAGQTLFGARARQPAGQECSGRNPWLAEPDVGRVAHGVPARVDRLRSLGNAVVPQIPELIGNAILASLQQAEAA